MIDSGLNLKQPQPQLIDHARFVDAIKRRKDVAAIPDCVGHGTAVTGIIAAQPHSGSPIVGVAPPARILAIKQTGDDGTGSDAALAFAIDAAAHPGAKVINISGGSYDTDGDPHEAVQRGAGSRSGRAAPRAAVPDRLRLAPQGGHRGRAGGDARAVARRPR